MSLSSDILDKSQMSQKFDLSIVNKCSMYCFLGGGATAGLMHGIVKEPWFIATLIGTIGGTLWFALCVFSVWLYRKRRARKKVVKNGVMNGENFI